MNDWLEKPHMPTFPFFSSLAANLMEMYYYFFFWKRRIKNPSKVLVVWDSILHLTESEKHLFHFILNQYLVWHVFQHWGYWLYSPGENPKNRFWVSCKEEVGWGRAGQKPCGFICISESAEDSLLKVSRQKGASFPYSTLKVLPHPAFCRGSRHWVRATKLESRWACPLDDPRRWNGAGNSSPHIFFYNHV